MAALLTSTPIGPSAARDRVDRRAQRRDVGDVAGEEDRPVRGAGELADERRAGFVLDVEEGDPRALAGEGAHEVGADAARRRR